MMLEQALSAAEPETRSDTPQKAGETVVRGRVTIDPDEPFLAGHYPGFPLVPGLSLVQYVHELVTGAAGIAAEEPPVLEKARFLSPVRPGQELLVEATLSRDGDGTRTSATVSADDRPAAQIRLRHRGTPDGTRPQESS